MDVCVYLCVGVNIFLCVYVWVWVVVFISMCLYLFSLSFCLYLYIHIYMFIDTCEFLYFVLCGYVSSYANMWISFLCSSFLAFVSINVTMCWYLIYFISLSFFVLSYIFVWGIIWKWFCPRVYLCIIYNYIYRGYICWFVSLSICLFPDVWV